MEVNFVHYWAPASRSTINYLKLPQFLRRHQYCEPSLVNDRRVKLRTCRMSSVAQNVSPHSKSLEDNIEKQKSAADPYSSIVVGCGGISIDYLASVEHFPQPDDKIRSTDLKIQGGGNVGNCLTGISRLGLRTRILTKVSNDSFGKFILEEFKADGVDTSFMVVSENGTTSFTYVIVDRETNTRTCINAPGYPPLDPNELPEGTFTRILDGASILYLDARLPHTAVLLAKEAIRKSIPILVDAERKREGLDDMLSVANYVVCSSKFPQEWTGASSLPEALLEITSRLQYLKFVIVTLGASGCLMFEKNNDGNSGLEIFDANSTYQTLLEEAKLKKGSHPFVVSSKVGLFHQRYRNGEPGKDICGRFLVGTAEEIPAPELVDTTGSGDAFIAAVIYSICTKTKPEDMLPFSALVAGSNCRYLGAREGLPSRNDPKLKAYLQVPFLRD